MLVFRVCKSRYAVFDPEGARRQGGRWHSPGRSVLYCAECFPGSLLEILAHAVPRRLPGAHHAARARIPSDLDIEVLDPASLPGWDAREPRVSRIYGDRWLAEARSAVLSVPAVSAKPFGRNILLSPAHRDFARIEQEDPLPVIWDTRVL